MDHEVLEYLRQSSFAASAVVVEGPGTGYRCIVGENGFFWENMPPQEESCRMFRWKAAAAQRTGLQQWHENKVFLEIFASRPKLVICGGGHVAQAVVRLARFLGFDVTVIEDRPLFADQAREAGADRVICDSFVHALNGLPQGTDTYYVIMTRGHQHDKDCLEAILSVPSAYVGMMGSKSRVRLLKETLEAEGVARELLDELHAPIGLAIGSETPEEIAVSVMGEIIRIKNQKKGAVVLSKEILRGLAEPNEKIMATIVMRKGSAPRQPGDRMLIFRDGRTVGTIGGGIAEAGVIAQSMELLREELHRPRLIRLDMTNQEAADAGMVCGGVLEIFLEWLPCCCPQTEKT